MRDSLNYQFISRQNQPTQFGAIRLKTTPVVLLAYNRPQKLAALIESLRSSAPKKIMVVVDGPKHNRTDDDARVKETQNISQTINWTDDVTFEFRTENWGLRRSVESAVTSAVELHGKAIMLEDDARPGKSWIPYANYMLEKYETESKVEHVSGYDLVPPSQLLSPNTGSRLSRYPESYAWATWQRAWKNYDGGLDWALNASLSELERIVGSKIGAIRWKQNFLDAQAGRISTWAYRWLASMWSRDSYMIAPNANLVTYDGYTDGTHTFLKPGWEELPRFAGNWEELVGEDLGVDLEADRWAAHHVYSETLYGVSRGVAISAVLELRKRYRSRK